MQVVDISKSPVVAGLKCLYGEFRVSTHAGLTVEWYQANPCLALLYAFLLNTGAGRYKEDGSGGIQAGKYCLP